MYKRQALDWMRISDDSEYEAWLVALNERLKNDRKRLDQYLKEEIARGVQQGLENYEYDEPKEEMINFLGIEAPKETAINYWT